jgi:DNA-binding MurR/RpiR family transcriptional regulator
MPLQHIFTATDLALTRKEQVIARVLSADYPAAGLSTVAALAQRADVSIPTVLRFVAKLGFDSFAAFQAALIRDVADRLNSPLSQLPRVETIRAPETVYQATMQTLADALLKARAGYDPVAFDRILDLLGDERCDIHCIGGRFSCTVAQRLAMHLAQIRPRVQFVTANTSALKDQIIDYGPQTVLAVFDYRRYQPDIIEFARSAHAARARIVLFTDRWLSPIGTFADEVLVSSVESLSPFDSWVPAFAQTEAIVAALVQRDPQKVRQRLAAIEAVRGAAIGPTDPVKPE